MDRALSTIHSILRVSRVGEERNTWLRSGGRGHVDAWGGGPSAVAAGVAGSGGDPPRRGVLQRREWTARALTVSTAGRLTNILARRVLAAGWTMQRSVPRQRRQSYQRDLGSELSRPWRDCGGHAIGLSGI